MRSLLAPLVSLPENPFELSPRLTSSVSPYSPAKEHSLAPVTAKIHRYALEFPLQKPRRPFSRARDSSLSLFAMLRPCSESPASRPATASRASFIASHFLRTCFFSARSRMASCRSLYILAAAALASCAENFKPRTSPSFEQQMSKFSPGTR